MHKCKPEHRLTQNEMYQDAEYPRILTLIKHTEHLAATQVVEPLVSTARSPTRRSSLEAHLRLAWPGSVRRRRSVQHSLARQPSLVAEVGFGASGFDFFSYIWTSNMIEWQEG